MVHKYTRIPKPHRKNPQKVGFVLFHIQLNSPVIINKELYIIGYDI